MPDPDDKTLLEFVARFAGFTDLQWQGPGDDVGEWMIGIRCGVEEPVPDYLNRLAAWQDDAWPKVKAAGLALQVCRHFESLQEISTNARDHAIGLYRALDGKLPEERSDG